MSNLDLDDDVLNAVPEHRVAVPGMLPKYEREIRGPIHRLFRLVG
jgi:hypothetical protein